MRLKKVSATLNEAKKKQDSLTLQISSIHDKQNQMKSSLNSKEKLLRRKAAVSNDSVNLLE